MEIECDEWLSVLIGVIFHFKSVIVIGEVHLYELYDFCCFMDPLRIVWTWT